MIFDVLLALITLGAFITGYKNGLFTTILRTIFFLAGAVAGAYFVIEHNKTGWLILSIVTGAYVSAWVGTQFAKSIKIILIRGPLRWIDSTLGALFEVAKYLILFYVIGTIILWSPWSAGQNDVSKSKSYLMMSEHAPSLLVEVKKQLENRLQ